MTELGDWVLGEPIGHGTGTVVHRGHHRLHPDRAVAIKRLRDAGASDGDAGSGSGSDAGDGSRGVMGGMDAADMAAVQATIEREAQVLRQLAHPAIMPFSDVVPDGAGIALVMPLATGGSLAARIRAEGALPWQDVADLGARIAGGLAAAHGAGIVHRDVTPTNILYGRELEPRLADFGAALVADDDQRIVGTAGYIDPMVPRGTPPGRSSDVYGLGVVLYEALAGQPPFAGATPEATMRAADRGIHLPLTSLAPDAPGNLAAIIEQAMQRDAAGRFPNAQQLQVALEHVALTASGHDQSTSWSPPLPPPQWAAGDVASGKSPSPSENASATRSGTGMPGDGSGNRGGADQAAGREAGSAGRAGTAGPGSAGAAGSGAVGSGAAAPGAADGLPASGDGTAATAGRGADDSWPPPPVQADRTASSGGHGSQRDSVHVQGAPGPGADPVVMPPTTDFGPRPMAPLEIEEARRPWWMVALLVAVVVLPLGVAAWALLANRDADVERTPPTATASPTPAPTSVSTTNATATPAAGLVSRTPQPLCEGQPEPTEGQLVGDVDGRGCSLTIKVQSQPDVTNLVVPGAAGPLAGTYALQGPPLAVVLGDWDGDGIDTPAVTLDTTGTVWGFPAWDAAQSAPIDDPIGAATPAVVTDADGIDHVVATGDA